MKNAKKMTENEFSFCESVYAGSGTRWCIRKLTSTGIKLGGGIDTPTLCERQMKGWDIDVTINDFHLFHNACPKCVEIYRKCVDKE